MVSLQELRYFVSVAEHLHFGRAALACHASQPTLSGQIRNLEEQLGVALFERTNKRVALTPAGEQILPHARRSLEEAAAVEAVAKAGGDPLAGPFLLGVIPTLAPYLMPLLLGPLREAYPGLRMELWEDQTARLVELLRAQKLDAALIATEVTEADLQTAPLFEELFVAALPPGHRLAERKRVRAEDLSGDLLVLAEGHCLAAQSLAVCGGPSRNRGNFQASSLETVVNLVAAGYGTTLVPRLAAETFANRPVLLKPMIGGPGRVVQLASRRTFPRMRAVQAIGEMIRGVVKPE